MEVQEYLKKRAREEDEAKVGILFNLFLFCFNSSTEPVVVNTAINERANTDSAGGHATSGSEMLAGIDISEGFQCR